MCSRIIQKSLQMPQLGASYSVCVYLNFPPIEELLWQIHSRGSQKFNHILAEGVEGRSRRVPTLQVIMEQEMHTSQLRQLKPIDRLALVLRSQQLLDLFNGQEAAQPVPLVVVSHEQTQIGVGSLVSTSAHDDVTERSSDGLAELG